MYLDRWGSRDRESVNGLGQKSTEVTVRACKTAGDPQYEGGQRGNHNGQNVE